MSPYLTWHLHCFIIIYFHLRLRTRSSVNLTIILAVFLSRKHCFHCSLLSNYNQCIYGRSISHTSSAEENRWVTTQMSTSPWKNSVSFTPSLWQNSTKLHPKWLLLTKTLHGKESIQAKKGRTKALMESWISCIGFIGMTEEYIGFIIGPAIMNRTLSTAKLGWKLPSVKTRGHRWPSFIEMMSWL